MRFMYWVASVFTIAIGVGLVTGARAVTAERPIVPDLELDALKEAVSWPKADVTAVMALAGRLMTGRRDAEGHENILPASLRDHPTAVMPYLVMRDNFVKRVYHQSTGYWKPDGEGMEVLAPAEWAAALDLLGGQHEDAFVRTVRGLTERGDDALALKLAQIGLVRYPASESLAALRRRALDNLRARYQQMSPFKFIIYSEWAGAELPSVQ